MTLTIFERLTDRIGPALLLGLGLAISVALAGIVR